MLARLLSGKDWLLVEERYSTEKAPVYETLFTLANGYVGVRGTIEVGADPCIPATFFAGLYDSTLYFDRELVNSPSWVGFRVYVCGEQVHMHKGRVIEYMRALDMKKGFLYQKLRWLSPRGRTTTLEALRIVHMARRRLSVIALRITPEDYEGEVRVETETTCAHTNSSSVEEIRVKHFWLRRAEPLNDEGGVYLEAVSRPGGARVAIASILDTEGDAFRDVIYRPDSVGEALALRLSRGDSRTFVKYVSFATSRDRDGLEGVVDRLWEARRLSMSSLLEEHFRAWERLWAESDIEIDGDPLAQKLVRFSVFHLLQLVNPDDERVSIPARGLHGEVYRGHIFWDTEIFMLPFYIYTQPRAARSLLMYRYHTLDAARKNAKLEGYRGAKYPWESADTGEEVCPREVLINLATGETVRIWTGDEEHHIVADVAYAVMNYYRVTGDEEFMDNYGLEILFETARFWASRVEYDEDKKAYVIRRAMGPDEFHEHVDNSAYTNYMAAWNLLTAAEEARRIAREKPEVWDRLRRRLGLTDKEVEEWEKIAKRMYLPIDSETGLIEEFEGYFKLKDVEVDFNPGSLPSLPKELLEKVKETKLVKQADVVLLTYLLDEWFDEKVKRINYEYYKRRTVHGSSLSPSIHAIIAAELGLMDEAYEFFMLAAKTDVDDLRGDTSYGIHAANLGGVWQAVVHGFAGLRVRRGRLCLNPMLPPHWKSISFKIKWRGQTLKVKVSKNSVVLYSPKRLTVNIRGRRIETSGVVEVPL